MTPTNRTTTRALDPGQPPLDRDPSTPAAEEEAATHYRSVPPRLAHAPRQRRRPLPRPTLRQLIAGAALLVVVAIVFLLPVGAPAGGTDGTAVLTPTGRGTLSIFLVAVWAWVFTRLDDTYVALAAGLAIVLLGVVDAEDLFSTLGDDTIWLLVAAFVIAAGVTSSGLATRATAWLAVAVRSVRGLVHVMTAALVVTAFAVPSTSGRAALAVPVFTALALTLGREEHRGRYRRAILVLALTFPTVILLSAVASLLGAGAHLVTSRVVASATGEGFDFVGWMILGLPLAVVSSHLAAELIMRMFGTRELRRLPIELRPSDFEATVDTPVTGPLTRREGRAALILVVVVTLWCTEPVHGVHPAIVALVGALATTLPRYGSVTLKHTLAKVPWSLLIFMAATLALADALVVSGAADWVAGAVFASVGLGDRLTFVVAVVAVSAAAHLVIQSRSARSAVLVPVVVALAPGVGVDPAAAAFASTAAAGFCHTLTSSAKPVAMFSSIEGIEGYTPTHLRHLSFVLGPLMIALVSIFSLVIWPLLGLPLWR